MEGEEVYCQVLLEGVFTLVLLEPPPLLQVRYLQEDARTSSRPGEADLHVDVDNAHSNKDHNIIPCAPVYSGPSQTSSSAVILSVCLEPLLITHPSIYPCHIPEYILGGWIFIRCDLYPPGIIIPHPTSEDTCYT